MGQSLGGAQTRRLKTMRVITTSVLFFSLATSYAFHEVIVSGCASHRSYGTSYSPSVR